MSIDDIIKCGIPINENTSETLLTVQTAVEWLQRNTNLKIDFNDINTIASLPSGAKLFIVKFCDLISQSDNVTSESIGGMSQSFSSGNKSDLLIDIAKQLIKPYLKSDFKFISAARRWG